MTHNSEGPRSFPRDPSERALLSGNERPEDIKNRPHTQGTGFQLDLLTNPAPRWRAGSIGGTAEAAAKAMRDKAPPLRIMVLNEIERHPASPEMIFAILKARGIKTVLTSVRPRCSELARMGLIADSGQRSPGEGGQPAIIWRPTDATERALFAARKAASAEKERSDG